MTPFAQHLLFRCLAREADVPIGSCVHFCGFRYGSGLNPYERYIATLVRSGDTARARADFKAFLQFYRPRDFGQALGVTLSRSYPLWLFPWSRAVPPAAWRGTQDECPDLLTHFTPAGIARRRIEAEFAWLERALDSIRRYGFRPERFRAPILARRLAKVDGGTAWLLLDGNHRVAALSALGASRVTVRYLSISTVREANLHRWSQVRRGRYDAQDASLVLHQYFEGNQRLRTVAEPAPVLEEEP